MLPTAPENRTAPENPTRSLLPPSGLLAGWSESSGQCPGPVVPSSPLRYCKEYASTSPQRPGSRKLLGMRDSFAAGSSGWLAREKPRPPHPPVRWVRPWPLVLGYCWSPLARERHPQGRGCPANSIQAQAVRDIGRGLSMEGIGDSDRGPVPLGSCPMMGLKMGMNVAFGRHGFRPGVRRPSWRVSASTHVGQLQRDGASRGSATCKSFRHPTSTVSRHRRAILTPARYAHTGATSSASRARASSSQGMSRVRFHRAEGV